MTLSVILPLLGYSLAATLAVVLVVASHEALLVRINKSTTLP